MPERIRELDTPGYVRAFTVSLTALATALASCFMTGYRAYIDDVMYGFGAVQWLNNPPHLGRTAWELRLPYILTMALSFRLFGVGGWQATVPGIAFYCATVAITHIALRRVLPRICVVLITILVLTSPLFLVQSTYITPDTTEAFFVVASFFAFVAGTRDSAHGERLILLAGVLAGLAFVTRETSAALILFYATLFLVSPQMKRPRYLLLAMAFVVPVVADIGLTTFLSGDPLYRLKIDIARHQPSGELSVFAEPSLIRPPENEELSWGSLGKPGGYYDLGYEPVGALSVSKWVDPYLALLANHEVALLFWILIPSVPIVLYSRLLPSEGRRIVLLAGLLGAVWFATVVYALGLGPLPRYFIIAGFGATFFVASAVWVLIQRKMWVMGVWCIAGLVGSNFLAANLEGSDLYEERRLVQLLEEHTDETVYVLPSTAMKARFFLETRGLMPRISTTVAPPGSLFFFTPRDAYHFDPDLRPPEHWVQSEPFRRRKTALAFVLGEQRLTLAIPGYLGQRLAYSSPGSGLYRLPKEGPGMTYEEQERLDSKHSNASESETEMRKKRSDLGGCSGTIGHWPLRNRRCPIRFA